jgi:hypothetical protein
MLKRITFPYAGLQPDVHGCDVEDVFPVPASSADDNASASSGGGTTRIGMNTASTTTVSAAAGAGVIDTRVSGSELGEDGHGSPRLPPDIARGVRLFRESSLT